MMQEEEQVPSEASSGTEPQVAKTVEGRPKHNWRELFLALIWYAEHRMDCGRRTTKYPARGECDCGLDELLRRAE